MLKNSLNLNAEQIVSPLLAASQLGPRKRANKNNGFPVLSLTSLIDAFSIIVIYLLISTTGNQLEIPLSPKIQLPAANRADVIAEITPIIRIEHGKYFIDDREVAESDLGRYLFALKQKLGKTDMPVLVQADQQAEFTSINPLIIASSQAGIQKLKLAVVPKE